MNKWKSEISSSSYVGCRYADEVTKHLMEKFSDKFLSCEISSVPGINYFVKKKVKSKQKHVSK